MSLTVSLIFYFVVAFSSADFRHKNWVESGRILVEIVSCLIFEILNTYVAFRTKNELD